MLTDTFHDSDAKQFAAAIDSVEEKPRTIPRGKLANQSNVPAENVPEYFKRIIMIPFLDFYYLK